jgi:transposase
MKQCPRCGGKKLWSLSTGQKRCSSCGLTRKFDTTLWQSTRISPYWKGRLLEFFSLGVPAYRLRFQVPLNPKTIHRWFRILREAIYYQQMNALSSLSGEIEMDETMFGGRVAGKRGWGAAGKRMVFGIYQRNGKVLTFPIASRGKHDLIPLMIHYTTAGGLYYTDDWHAYTFLDIRGNHVVIRKEKGRPKGRDHLNGIEGFWSYAKHWLYHYRGVPKKYFHLYLKEIEWRFNNRNENLVILLRDILHQRVVKEQNLVQL